MELALGFTRSKFHDAVEITAPSATYKHIQHAKRMSMFSADLEPTDDREHNHVVGLVHGVLHVELSITAPSDVLHIQRSIQAGRLVPATGLCLKRRRMSG